MYVYTFDANDLSIKAQWRILNPLSLDSTHVYTKSTNISADGKRIAAVIVRMSNDGVRTTLCPAYSGRALVLSTGNRYDELPNRIHIVSKEVSNNLF